MRTFGNVLWLFLFFGWVNVLAALIGGALCCATVVGAPIGLGLLQYAKFLCLPFSLEMHNRSDVTTKERSNTMKWLGKLCFVLYVPFGIILWLIGIVQCIALFVTIVGIPAGAVMAKSLSTLYNPIDKVCVDRDVANIIRTKIAEEKYETMQAAENTEK